MSENALAAALRDLAEYGVIFVQGRALADQVVASVHPSAGTVVIAPAAYADQWRITLERPPHDSRSVAAEPWHEMAAFGREVRRLFTTPRSDAHDVIVGAEEPHGFRARCRSCAWRGFPVRNAAAARAEAAEHASRAGGGT